MLVDLFTTYIYAPFFNLLVSIYWVLQQIPSLPHQDMGIAVIIFTIATRIILMPISLASSRSEKERRDIEEKAKELDTMYESDPIALRQKQKELFHTNRRVIIAESFNLFIQVSIALMLWRIFATGLEGADIHLLYSFTPHPPQPYDLMFLDKYDLSHPHFSLNLLQSLVIFAVEVLSVLTSPFKTTRKDIIRMQFFLPVVSFIIFSQLPAGKKLFVITTLIFSFFFMLFRHLYHLIYKYLLHPEEPTSPAEATVVSLPQE
jgi:membrane protein insertase Oxa1/YidC/SpoIIIJ